MTDRSFLISLGLNPDGDNLAPVIEDRVVIDLTTTPVKDLVFTEEMMDGIDPSQDRNGAVTAIWKKCRTKDSDRNRAVWAAAQSWVTHFVDSRKSGGLIKEKVKSTKEERELAKLIASQGLSVEDLTKVLNALKEVKE